MGRRVLITGISRYLGGRLAQALERDPDIEYIVGVDLDEPEVDLERTEYVRADIRNPLVVKVLQTTEVDTVIHLNIVATPVRAGGRMQMKEINVIGTMQLFAACQKAPAIKKLVMKSSTAVYGSDSRDPALFTEEMGPRSARTGYAKDAMEVEQYARDFGRRRPDVDVTILRFANFMGPEIETPLTRYFALPVVPTALGYDPRLQFLHEQDAIEVLHRATSEPHPGIYNVAGDGIVLLSQALRLMGRTRVPLVLPLTSPVAGIVRRLGLVDFATDQLQFLLFGRVADNERLKREFGFTPAFSSKDALLDYARGRKISRVMPAKAGGEVEREVYSFLRRKGQERFEKTRT